MTFSVIEGTLSAAVADTGTFTVGYPSGKDVSNFYLAMGHKLMLGQNGPLSFPDDFGISLGVALITVSNRTGATWAAGTAFKLQMEEPGQRGYKGDNGQLLASATEVKGIVVSMAPDVSDADGVSVSQTVTGAGTAFTITGALATGGVATMDTPRNVVAAWTNTAVLTITGTDVYGDEMVEVTASGTSHTGLKAFKTVTSVTTSATVTSATVGSGNVIGLPVFLPAAGNVLNVMQDGVRLVARAFIPWELEQTQLLAPTNEQLVSPIAGIIDRNTTIVQAAVTTGGDITVKVGSTDVTGLTNTVADGATAGTIATDQPTTVTGNDATTQVAARGQIQIVPGSPFATAGEVNGVLEVNGWGVFTAGTRTADGSTSTGGDVRGTFRPPVDPDGSIVFQVVLALADPGVEPQAQYTV